MLKNIFTQLWNQRRMNGWIFIELLLVGFFLWTVVDPIAVLTGTNFIPRGYDSDGRYMVRMNAYTPNHVDFPADQSSDSLCKLAYERIIRELRHMPEVEEYAIVRSSSFPNSSSYSGGFLFSDTASLRKNENRVNVQHYEFSALDDSNIFATYGIKDANTGRVLVLPEDCTGKLFISSYAAQQLYGTTDVVGKKVTHPDGSEQEIAGVFREFKHRDFEQPTPLTIKVNKYLRSSIYMHWMYVFVFKLKDGVNAEAFEERFHAEVAPRLKQGIFYLHSLKDFETVSEEYATMAGTNNKLRLQYSLATFALLSIFLGMVGTFWIRCNARRQEIGVMRSMGASCTTIIKQFLLEAFMLVTIAFLAIQLPLYFYTSAEGMYSTILNAEVGNPAYWMNREGTHFVFVSLLTYLLLLLTALIGTYIPVRHAANVLPADALRDE